MFAATVGRHDSGRRRKHRVIWVGVVLLGGLGSCVKGGGEGVSPSVTRSQEREGARVEGAAEGCPREVPQETQPNDREEAIRAARSEIPRIYDNVDITDYEMTAAYRAEPTKGFGAIAFSLCGADIGDKTWVVELRFPKERSASTGQGQMFLAKFEGGWRVWTRYH